MTFAYEQALIGFQQKEVPVGAVIIYKDQILVKTFNQIEKLHHVTAHAEILSINSASNYLGKKYLNDCTLYVTLEPCIMCAGALYWSQIGTVVIGASDPRRGFILSGIKLHPKTKLVSNILEKRCSNLLKKFFYTKR